ncbi:MAG: TIGR00730 family Rossman fold protein [Acidobacteria bacterium]|nr:TIGR00730 family Rossman fold protein [Acidobacteriota bacterium]MCI0627159.1 TIGR00730 family Rossman fold protein [Acidobacteriota bacterium]MCI0717427.1 TIGR00730 family Rossman fold protein [Acidobacteriota bacterium]
MQRLCVFCGSSVGRREAFRQAALELGRLLAEQNLELVYGGGNCGLMGILADEVLTRGGRVIGVIPEGLMAKELGHLQLTELRIVASMHDRKALMCSLADGFIALPGGFGTFEELFEVVTWSQLRLHRKPIGVVNVEGFFDPVLGLMHHAIREGFVRPGQRELLFNSASPKELLEVLRNGYPAATL